MIHRTPTPPNAFLDAVERRRLKEEFKSLEDLCAALGVDPATLPPIVTAKDLHGMGVHRLKRQLWWAERMERIAEARSALRKVHEYPASRRKVEPPPPGVGSRWCPRCGEQKFKAMPVCGRCRP